MTSPFSHTFSNRQVVEATAATSDNIQNWIVRGHLTGSSLPEGGGSQGKHRRFSFHNLMEVAVAKALINAGLSNLDDVFLAAKHFAHIADTQDNKIRRLPGLPYRDGITLLIAGSGSYKAIKIGGAKRDDLDLFAEMSGTNTGRITGAVWLDASEIFRQVMTRAGFDPDAVMREAYGR
jgi:hypothetical protein